MLNADVLLLHKTNISIFLINNGLADVCQTAIELNFKQSLTFRNSFSWYWVTLFGYSIALFWE